MRGKTQNSKPPHSLLSTPCSLLSTPMITLYAPGTNEPRLVPDMEVKSFLLRGYRRQHPQRPATIASVNPATVAPADESKSINVNTASLKDLAALPGGSMLVANVLKSKRPFKTLEDLIEATEEINWAAIESTITF